jgi:ABC-2 type transport system ATP-binding protein
MTSALTIRNLTKAYTNGFRALKGIDLDVPVGDFFALLGPNGAGKSTTIGIVCSLVNKSRGKVFIFGRDIDTDFANARRLIGLVPQEFNFNVFEPVIEIVVNQAGYYGIDRRVAFEAAEELLHQLGLWEKRRGMARELSGGMKRRLMIARALIHQPTHYLEEAESLCRNIAIIDEGRLVENSSMRQLLDKLHTETFVFYLKDPVPILPEFPGHDIYQVDEQTIEVSLSKERNLNGLFHDFSKKGIEILTMKNKTNRLEELFMTMIGNKTDGLRG